MLTESAKVIAIEDDGLWVETLKQSACNACSAKSGCGQHLLANYMRDMTYIKARFNSGNAQRIWNLGDQVEIGVNENALVINALLVYLLPLAGMLSFAALGHAFKLPDLMVATGAFAGLFIAAWIIRKVYPFLRERSTHTLDVVVME